MQVNQIMLDAAVKVAVSNGLLPPRMDSDVYLKSWESIRQIIQAALDTSPNLAEMSEVSIELNPAIAVTAN